MGTDERESESMHERAPESGLKIWLLLEANRVAITLVVLVAMFVAMVGVLLLEPAVFEGLVQQGDPIQTLFQAVLTAIVTGVTVVVSINSMVLSQELAPVGAQREKMDNATDFRDDIAAMIGEPVSPAEPAAFLRAMLEETSRRAAALRDAVDDAEDDSARDEISEYAGEIDRDADRVAERLKGTEFGTFDVVSAALNFDYSRRLYAGTRLKNEHEDVIDDEAHERLDETLSILHEFGPSREHIKTLYFQWELVNLSRAMLYAAIPALVVTVLGVLALGDPQLVPGSTLGLANQGWVVVAATTVALSPFAILLSYILRIATVAKRTLAIGPFVLRGEEDGGRSPAGD